MTEKTLSLKIEPLTRLSAGVLLTRREQVTRELEDLAAVNYQALSARVLVMREAQEHSLKSETLVYLLREFYDKELFNTVYDTLSRRIFSILASFRENVASFEDFKQTVELAFLEKVLDFDTNAGEYAQVSFGEFVLGLALNEYRKTGTQKSKAARTDSIDEPTESETGETINFELRSKDLSPEKRLLLAAALAELPEHVRKACILHYLGDWKIKSNRPGEPTLVAYFGKSERQIRTWIKSAAAHLADWQGVL